MGREPCCVSKCSTGRVLAAPQPARRASLRALQHATRWGETRIRNHAPQHAQRSPTHSCVINGVDVQAGILDQTLGAETEGAAQTSVQTAIALSPRQGARGAGAAGSPRATEQAGRALPGAALEKVNGGGSGRGRAGRRRRGALCVCRCGPVRCGRGQRGRQGRTRRVSHPCRERRAGLRSGLLALIPGCGLCSLNEPPCAHLLGDKSPHGGLA